MKRGKEILENHGISLCLFKADKFEHKTFYISKIGTMFVRSDLGDDELVEILTNTYKLGILSPPPPIIFMYRYKGEFSSSTLEAVTI